MVGTRSSANMVWYFLTVFFLRDVLFIEQQIKIRTFIWRTGKKSRLLRSICIERQCSGSDGVILVLVSVKRLPMVSQKLRVLTTSFRWYVTRRVFCHIPKPAWCTYRLCLLQRQRVWNTVVERILRSGHEYTKKKTPRWITVFYFLFLSMFHWDLS